MYDNIINSKIMPNKRFRYHPYLSENFLKRGCFNYCCICGRRMGNIQPGIRNTYQYWALPDDSDSAVFVGYCHKICPDSSNGTDKYKVKLE